MIWFKFRLCSHGQQSARDGFQMLFYQYFINFYLWRKSLVCTKRVDLHNHMTLRYYKCHKHVECHSPENSKIIKITIWHHISSGQMCKVIFCVAVAQTKGADGDHCRPVAQIAKVRRPRYPTFDNSSRYRVVLRLSLEVCRQTHRGQQQQQRGSFHVYQDVPSSNHSWSQILCDLQALGDLQTLVNSRASVFSNFK